MLLPLLLAFQGATAPADSLEQERVLGSAGTRIDSALTRLEAQGFHGTVLVVRDRRIVLLKGYGLANQEAHVRNTPATRFEQNSITKMFTGASTLQLAATGMLRLDDPIERYPARSPRRNGARRSSSSRLTPRGSFPPAPRSPATRANISSAT